MTGRTGRYLVDASMRVNEMDEAGLRTAMSYLIGASARSVAVRRAIQGALDAADATARPPFPQP